MKRINEKLTVSLTLDDANYINELLERDTAKAVRHNDEYDWNYCPACNKIILGEANFCEKCGQKLDTENYAL